MQNHENTTIRRDKEWSECLLKLVARMNNFDYLYACQNKDYIPLLICGHKVGVVTPPVLAELKNYPDVFDVVNTNGPGSPGKSVSLKEKFTTEEERSEAINGVLCSLRAKDKFKALKGWRNECAGGLASGLTVRECAIKECQEEASVDDENLKNLKPVGTISYCYTDERGILADTEYLFDLELSPDFVPTNADGEVDNFYLFTLKEVQDRIVAGEFKSNCSLVILDFLMRHGFINHEDEPNYSYLSERMHMSIQPSF